MGLAEIKTYAQKMQDAQVTKSLVTPQYIHLGHRGVIVLDFCLETKQFHLQSCGFIFYLNIVLILMTLKVI